MLKHFVAGVVVAFAMLTGITKAEDRPWVFQQGEDAYQRGDYAGAVRLWRPLAEHGNVTAQYNLGVMYANGHGVQRDYGVSSMWLRRAAEQGHVHSRHDLGLRYLNGEGVPRDYVLAHMWFSLAAAQGYEIAKQDRDLVAALMTADQLAEAQRLAREWKPTAVR